jgi:hypothetical protein
MLGCFLLVAASAAFVILASDKGYVHLALLQLKL